MPPKTIISLRVDEHVLARFDAAAQRDGAVDLLAGRRGGNHNGRDTGRTAVLQRLMELYAEDRLRIVEPAGVSPFPGETIQPGETPEFPIEVTPAFARKE